MLFSRTIRMEPVVDEFVGPDQITCQGQAAHDVRLVNGGQVGNVSNILFWE